MTPLKPRNERLIRERVHDAYKAVGKLREPSVCPGCSAVFKEGRWQWLDSWPADAHKDLCQACRRIRDDYPAGLVTMNGDFVKTHREDVLGLARNVAQSERDQHPLHRIIRVEEGREALLVSTTDLHLPKRIGQALRRAYKGRLDLQYEKAGCFLRVNWTSRSEWNHTQMQSAKSKRR